MLADPSLRTHTHIYIYPSPNPKPQVQRTAFGIMQTQVVCDQCDGTGEVIAEKCPDCKGAVRAWLEDVDTTVNCWNAIRFDLV